MVREQVEAGMDEGLSPTGLAHPRYGNVKEIS